MIIKVAEIEPGAPEGQLTEMVRLLRGVAPQIALEFHYRQRPPAYLKALGCAMAGFQLPRNDEWLTLSEQQGLLQGIASWRAIVQSHGLKLFVDRFDSAALLRAAAPLVDFATSDRLWPAMDRPGDVRSAPLPAPAAGRPAVSAAS